MDFKSFTKNPVVAILFIAVCGLGYLYIDNKAVYETLIMKHEEQIQELKVELNALRKDYKVLNDKFIEALKDME